MQAKIQHPSYLQPPLRPPHVPIACESSRSSLSPHGSSGRTPRSPWSRRAPKGHLPPAGASNCFPSQSLPSVASFARRRSHRAPLRDDIGSSGLGGHPSSSPHARSRPVSTYTSRRSLSPCLAARQSPDPADPPRCSRPVGLARRCQCTACFVLVRQRDSNGGRHGALPRWDRAPRRRVRHRECDRRRASDHTPSQLFFCPGTGTYTSAVRASYRMHARQHGPRCPAFASDRAPRTAAEIPPQCRTLRLPRGRGPDPGSTLTSSTLKLDV
ncbi:hypothetical protein C8Q80DRAFT_675533 [Daedaleopsis nitida]|nr:hypothetical protein C8Q80DRAFT_675533 [Daedaleopsis nitida]